jgi:hypothetical protein
MAKTKQYVFSPRTTEAGLIALNDLKKKLGIGWDEMVVDAVCGHYNLDRSVLMLPKAEVKAKPATEEAKPKVEGKKKPKSKKAKNKAAQETVAS